MMSNNAEQPVIKRQRIDNRNGGTSCSESSEKLQVDNIKSPPDIIAVKNNKSSTPSNSTKSHTTSSSTISDNISIPNSITSSPTSSHNSSIDEVDKMSQESRSSTSPISNTDPIPDLLRTNLHVIVPAHKTNNTAMCSKPLLPPPACSSNNNFASSSSTAMHLDNKYHTESNEMAEFEEYLVKQCLCGVSEAALRKPFESHYNHDTNGTKRIAKLSEWPTNKLLQFLSNLQLLFDIYLKQNSKGLLCSRIMDICEALILNDRKLIDEIIELGNFNNNYVQFLSGRVLASFLVIAKAKVIAQNEEIATGENKALAKKEDNWLRKIVDILFSAKDQVDAKIVRKIQFSLDIIKRIVEWKDIELHPLEDNENSSEVVLPPQPSLENNYFAVHFNPQMAAGTSTQVTSMIRNVSEDVPPHKKLQISSENNNCHLISLTDSESFDTTDLKCVTIENLEEKWPDLVKKMSQLIITRDLNSENCILTFLCLWENIISVKANLSIVQTEKFYAKLDKFEALLQQQHLSCSIYKQMLCLFNEALCYGSTLALQDLLPNDTRKLATCIINHVKDFRILNSLPRRSPENCVSFLGYKGRGIAYDSENTNWQSQPDNSSLTRMEITEIPDMDKTILQKMVLLVLKSIAVAVKDIRSDSSDSSIDSTDYDAFQEMVTIENSIRDVLRKLEHFIKTTLEFHPECHFSKILIHLFDDQDDHLIEAMVCTLDVTSGISYRNNAFPELVAMLNPMLTFLEFLKMISNSSDLLLDLLVSNETCFLLYLLRFLKYIRVNWDMFIASCTDFDNNNGGGVAGSTALDNAMSVLIRLRLQISRLVSKSLYPYDISPVLRLLESCETLYEGNELP